MITVCASVISFKAQKNLTFDERNTIAYGQIKKLVEKQRYLVNSRSLAQHSGSLSKINTNAALIFVQITHSVLRLRSHITHYADVQIKLFIIRAVLRRSVERICGLYLSRHCTCATQLISKKCSSRGKPWARLRPIRPARDLNLRPPAPEANALPLNQLYSSELLFVQKFDLELLPAFSNIENFNLI